MLDTTDVTGVCLLPDNRDAPYQQAEGYVGPQSVRPPDPAGLKARRFG